MFTSVNSFTGFILSSLPFLYHTLFLPFLYHTLFLASAVCLWNKGMNTKIIVCWTKLENKLIRQIIWWLDYGFHYETEEWRERGNDEKEKERVRNWENWIEDRLRFTKLLHNGSISIQLGFQSKLRMRKDWWFHKMFPFSTISLLYSPFLTIFLSQGIEKKFASSKNDFSPRSVLQMKDPVREDCREETFEIWAYKIRFEILKYGWKVYWEYKFSSREGKIP